MKTLLSKYSRLKVCQKTLRSIVLNKRKRWFVDVLCDCGIRKTVNADDLSQGKIKSCGCLSRESSSETLKILNKKLKLSGQYPGYIHGDTGKRFHVIFTAMLSRCNNTKNCKYPRYGGRGIKVEWDSYESFKKDMYKSYQKHVDKFGIKNTSIDRIDNEGNYCKENCKWSTSREQSNNTSRNNLITKDGIALSVTEWSRKLGINRSTINSRIHLLNITDVNIILKKGRLKYDFTI